MRAKYIHEELRFERTGDVKKGLKLGKAANPIHIGWVYDTRNIDGNTFQTLVSDSLTSSLFNKMEKGDPRWDRTLLDDDSLVRYVTTDNQRFKLKELLGNYVLFDEKLYDLTNVKI
jgi:hypothetical protein